MAYCNKCGAYIPDGQSKCLACGFDEEEEAAAAQASAQAAARQREPERNYHFRNNDEIYRTQLEENRRRQQEQNRKWAEQEQARRRQQAEYQARQNEESRSSAGEDMRRDFEQGFGQENTIQTNRSWTSERLWSVLSYVSVLCLVPLVLGKGGEQANFHAKQGLRLVIFGVFADVLSWIPLVGWALSMGRIALMVIGIINALNGRRRPLPYIGNIGNL